MTMRHSALTVIPLLIFHCGAFCPGRVQAEAGTERTLRIGNQEFSTRRSNCFIVRLSESWQPSTTQLPVLIVERLPLKDV